MVVKGDGYEGSCEITVKPYNTGIWEATAYKDADGLKIKFNDDVALLTGTGCVIIESVKYDAKVLDDKRTVEVLGIDAIDFVSGIEISIKGVKYPVLFPSYSFTFTVNVL